MKEFCFWFTNFWTLYTQTSTVLFKIISWLINFPVRLKMAVNNCTVIIASFFKSDDRNTNTACDNRVDPNRNNNEKEA
jgi:hypothetical protein